MPPQVVAERGSVGVSDVGQRFVRHGFHLGGKRGPINGIGAKLRHLSAYVCGQSMKGVLPALGEVFAGFYQYLGMARANRYT